MVGLTIPPTGAAIKWNGGMGAAVFSFRVREITTEEHEGTE
jgi:hypothetical protein